MKFSSKPMVAAVRISLLSLIAVFGFALVASAQNFSSGSDGSDGALDLTGTTPGTTVTFVPANFPGDQHSLNIFNFTTITIPASVTVRLSALKINGPVYWLASGNVDIEGTIDLSGQAGIPAIPTLTSQMRAQDAGAGGYSGGAGGKTDGSPFALPEPIALPGDGPGGGPAGSPGCDSLFALVGSGGAFSSNTYLVPLVGGSGGGGGLFWGPLGSEGYGAGGGAGGGALLIASSTTVTVNGTINANGGAGGFGGASITNPCTSSQIPVADGGGGSGGGIRLAANTLAGSGTLSVSGGAGSSCKTCGSGPVDGGSGQVRIEAFTNTFTGTVTGPSITATPFQTFVPVTAPPTFSVISVGTSTLPAVPTGSFTAPDATINTSSAVTLTVQTSGIPVGTVLSLYVISDNTTNQVVQSTPLTGTLQSATATATVTFPTGYSLNYVKATW